MKQPKKSETLEVRLSHPDKIALQERAAHEGRTVSDVVRELISSYIGQSETRSKPSYLMELFMTLKSKPKSVAAIFAGLPLLAIPFLLPTTANAGDIALTLESEYTEPTHIEDTLGSRVRRLKTEIEIDEDKFFSFPIAKNLEYDPNASFYLSLRVYEESNRTVAIDISICEITNTSPHLNNTGQFSVANTCEGKKLIAQPTISAKYGETAEFRFETEYPLLTNKVEDSDIDGAQRKIFKLMVSPKKL